jgi:DNA polymerase elongation subunit (family B)/DNA-directed RNA polymerase subunit RPC12/RpoP
LKILLLDIETSPNTAHVWGLWQQNVSINQLMESSYVLCYAAKWLGDEDIYFDSVHQSKPKIMLKGIHALLESADAVIHYNGTKFDIPTLNKEFLLSKLLPPSPYKQIDLLRVVRSNFRFPSNKLDYVSQRLGLGKKHAHEGHDLWVKCMNGDKDAWKRMEEYNIQDVVLLESLYENLLPWIKNAPNRNLYQDIAGCPTCGSTRLQKRGTAVSATGAYQRYQCRDCGSWSQGTKSIKKTVEVKHCA